MSDHKQPESNQYTEYVETIQANALNNDLPNGIPTELTYQQALSIWLRSCQLVKEGAMHSIHPKKLANQIEICYKQQFRKQRQNNKKS